MLLSFAPAFVIALAAFGDGQPTAVADDPHLAPSVGMSQGTITQLVVPDYQKRAKESSAYRADIVAYRRSNLGIAGEDFLLVTIVEGRPCELCAHAVLGGVDLRRQTSIGGERVEDASAPIGDVELVKRGKPWRVTYRYTSKLGNYPHPCGSLSTATASLKRGRGGWYLVFHDPITTVEGDCD
jgi:hypothetical protein